MIRSKYSFFEAHKSYKYFFEKLLALINLAENLIIPIINPKKNKAKINNGVVKIIHNGRYEIGKYFD